MNKVKVQKTIDYFFKSKRQKITNTKAEENANKCVESIGSSCLENSEINENDCKKRKIMNKDELENTKNIYDNNLNMIRKTENEIKNNEKASDYIEEIRKLMDIEWFKELQDELKKSYFKNMYLKIKEERKIKVIYPPEQLVFNAFLKTPLSKIKVVIVGQDPYHQKNQAMGLSFSVPFGIKIPPSLKNILKEIKQKSNHGNLISWSEQGVFLLNTSLTVEENKPASHKNYGWETFTDKVINIINQKKEKIIFMLWGNFAIKKCSKIDTTKHFILKAGHPSPLSIRHFENCDHFNKCNKILIENNLVPIKWELPQ
ncbi:uracil-DNA glycosylase, putative [Plasmodium gallinaceum]|uniref:Uracil-DNA glycosylase n=1 Tax=Plasmodium gallinaceum TaxID=5849 RepID=A0A1J1GWI6_PLAGA|nr:uracil-DNA glycosylase, putative [Plasmodium gallinaceum]CRG95669.1 uracil-DNA glycosylase, putative [Plasmodium gallinaceum]